MAALVIVVVVIVGITVIGLIVRLLQSTRDTVKRVAEGEPERPTRHRPSVAEFHVKGDTATTVFDVPLGDTAPGRHLVDILESAAVEHVRYLSDGGLPIADVRHIEVFAMRGGSPEKIGTVDLPDTGVLPAPHDTVLIEPKDDPIAAVVEVVADSSVAAQPAPSSGSDLEPVAEYVELSGPAEAFLRSTGVDPSSMSLADLTLGILTVAGYTITEGDPGFSLPSVPDATLRRMARDGKRAILAVVPHEPGSHPELDDRVLAEFSVAVAQVNPDHGVIVSDKFSPYAMYERERRDKRLVCITRERLQAFCDSVGV